MKNYNKTTFLLPSIQFKKEIQDGIKKVNNAGEKINFTQAEKLHSNKYMQAMLESEKIEAMHENEEDARLENSQYKKEINTQIIPNKVANKADVQNAKFSGATNSNSKALNLLNKALANTAMNETATIFAQNTLNEVHNKQNTGKAQSEQATSITKKHIQEIENITSKKNEQAINNESVSYNTKPYEHKAQNKQIAINERNNTFGESFDFGSLIDSIHSAVIQK